MKGTWQGSGTWQTSGPGIGPVLALAAVIAVLSYLATLLLIAAIVLAVLVVLSVPAVVWMRGWTRREQARFSARVASFPDEPQVTAGPPEPRAVQNHYHLHLPEAGATTDPRVLDALRAFEPINREEAR